MNKLSVKDFNIEYRAGGIGIDAAAPVFSWKLVSDKQNTVQNSYRLRVSGGKLDYDTGVIDSGQSVCVQYTGGKLAPQTEYRAEIGVIDNRGDKASAYLTFETGLMPGGNFTADFISADTPDRLACFEVFKGFSVKKKIVKARAYATALGMYTLSVNGKRAGDLYFAPYWTSYNKMLEYQTYDVTPLLKPGENEAAVTVAKGWCSGELVWTNHRDIYTSVNAALLELHIFYDDGSKDVIKTGKDWQARRSFIIDSEIYHGETQDFTQKLNEIFPVKKVGYDKSKIVAQINEPCRVIEKRKPVKHIITPKGEQVLDFGQNLVGVAEFKIKGVKGQTVILKHAEILDEKGNFYTENLRGAKSTDTFILSGGEQILSSVFTFHGFRFLQITGAEIALEDCTALVIHSDMKPAGTLVTSSPLVNQLISNIRWGQRGNFVDVPTDCPQRDERLGWTGDINAFARTATFNYNVAPFLRKWLCDVRNDQIPDGGIPSVIPDVLGQHGNGAEAMWSSAAVMVPWTLYNVYGDIRFISEHYQCMRKYIDKLLSVRNKDGLIDKGHQYADWLSLDGGWMCETTRGATDYYFIANVFCAIVLEIFCKAARLTGKAGDGKKYSAIYDKLLKKIRGEYFTKTGRMVTETQTACVLALNFNIAPDALRPKIAGRLENAMKRFDNKLATGFIGTPFLCFALSDNGLHGYAESLLLNEEYPGWLHPVKLGATTIWERWNSLLPDGRPNPNAGMNSYNHYAYGSVGEFLWRRAAGIDYLEPGYKKIKIAPRIIKGLDSVCGEYDSVYGVIASGYELKDGKLKITVKIPVNTTAEILLPGKEASLSVGSGEYVYEIQQG